MLIYTKNNSDKWIHFQPKTQIDAMKIGEIRYRLTRKNVPFKMEIDPQKQSIEKLSIKQSDLIDLLSCLTGGDKKC